jgi:BirA family biotin operon repressor/biotin-[acetyl-CoA-carboxylase] ligase
MLTPTILRFDSLPSTNDEAARQALAGAPEGLCIVAREQTAGRGRQHRTWQSPKDAGLYFSILLRPSIATSGWPLIPLMAALAVADALRQSASLATDIKWPNDILARGRKLAGILAETVETPTGRAVVLGIGINLDDRAFPFELRELGISVAAETRSAPSPETILQSLTAALARRYENLLDEGGAESVVHEWSARSSYAHGKLVRVALADEIFEGRTSGLEPDGALRVETSDGMVRIVRAGDVTALREVKIVNRES